MTKLNAFLIDIDGVLALGDSKIDGADSTLKFLTENNLNYQLFTNVTRNSKKTLLNKLNKLGFSLDSEKIITPISTAIELIKEKKQDAKCFLIAPNDVEEDFKTAKIKITRKDEPVDFVVIGLDKRIDYETMNIAFHALRRGAELIALHVDKFYPKENTSFISLGAFVKGLEYSSEKTAYIVGKPNKSFFENAFKKLGAKKEETAVIGDSLEGDIGGGANAGFKTILVKTGNFKESDLNHPKIKPDYVIDSIKDLPKLIK